MATYSKIIILGGAIDSKIDNLRTVAGHYLYQKNKKADIFVSGKTISKIIKRGLAKAGIPKIKIKEENKSRNTFQQLQQFEKILAKDKNSTVIISSKYHIPRIKAMVKYGNFAPFKKVKLISAEDILIKNDKTKWQPFIDKMYRSPKMKKIIEMEKKGIQDIKKGEYQ